MDNKEDLPKANSPSKGKKILVYALVGVVGLLLLTALLPEESAPASANSALNVTLDGWNFAANIGDGWRADPTVVPDTRYESPDCSNKVTWSGAYLGKPYFIPKKTTEEHYSGLGGKSGYVNIAVLQIPSELKALSTTMLLAEATDNAHCHTVGEGSDEDLTFNGKEAHLWKQDETLDGKAYSFGIVAMKLNDDEVAIIEVERWDESGNSATDVINSFTTSPMGANR